MFNIFVYGTLKEGFPNYKTNKGRRINGHFVTINRYPLYLIGERFSPWLILKEGEGHNVRGQVFSLSVDALYEMDKLERISEPDGYRRVKLTVVSETTGEEQVVFAYGKPVEQLSDADVRKEINGDYTPEYASLYRSRVPEIY
jgi:gamma-glutamylaminecyclotransferase